MVYIYETEKNNDKYVYGSIERDNCFSTKQNYRK